MTEPKPESWDRLQELFEAALQRDSGKREDFIAEACGDDRELRRELKGLLAAHEQAGDALESPPADAVRWAELLADAPINVPERIGRYEIKGVIASGGMGTVYEAEQDHPRRTVALKVMRWSIASPSAQRRFHYESQLLARLRHPGIAQVFEAGTHADGTHRVPYFAMEYVPGARPITGYAKNESLDLPGRLELFARVCDAVHHGHQKGVIHRDLKPGNILVDADGQPRVIDFGIARSTDSDIAVTTMQTGAGQLIGTLQYMSPEQCRADSHDIDTRSDVYALGVVLYELLCGRPPYDVARLALHEATQAICEQPPTKLSTVDARLRGDLETVVQKALEKDRDARYRSAAELADDVRRYLAGEAILAHPPSMTYQLRKFARRHKALVASVATVFAVLVAGVIVSTYQYVEAEAARAEAVAVTTWVTDALSKADLREGRGPDLKLRTVLAEAAEKLQTDPGLAAQPAVKATLHGVIGNAYLSHGGYSAEAEKHFRAALAIRHRLYGDEHPKVAESLHDLAVSIRYRPDDDGQEHMAMLRQALDMRRELLGEEHLDTLTSMCQLAGSLCDRVDPEAEVLYRKVLEGRRRVLGREHPQVAGALAGLGTYLDWTSRPAEALPFVQEALAIRRKRLKKGHPSIASALTTLGGVHAGLGNLDDAERAYREALKIYRKTYTDDHVYLLSTPGHLGRVLLEKGEPEEAEPFLQEALRKIAARAAKAGQSEGNRDEWARCRTQLARHQVFMGACVSRLGRHAEAESFLLDANSIMTDLLADSRAQNQPEVNWPRGLRKVLREARQRLVELYTAWGKPGAAAQWKARLAEQGEEQDRPGTDRVK